MPESTEKYYKTQRGTERPKGFKVYFKKLPKQVRGGTVRYLEVASGTYIQKKFYPKGHGNY